MLSVSVHIFSSMSFFIIDWSLTSSLCIMKEWPESSYPPWAHGPGYVVSQDIAEAVYKRHKKGQLKVWIHGKYYLLFFCAFVCIQINRISRSIYPTLLSLNCNLLFLVGYNKLSLSILHSSLQCRDSFLSAFTCSLAFERIASDEP